MLHIFCPHCGELRSEEEFHASGQAHIPRPLDPTACTDAEWGDYLFFRDNPRGLHHELWNHVAGCRQFFNATRAGIFKTATDDVHSIGQQCGR